MSHDVDSCKGCAADSPSAGLTVTKNRTKRTARRDCQYEPRGGDLGRIVCSARSRKGVVDGFCRGLQAAYYQVEDRWRARPSVHRAGPDSAQILPSDWVNRSICPSWSVWVAGVEEGI
jgi:hypothetical protein